MRHKSMRLLEICGDVAQGTVGGGLNIRGGLGILLKAEDRRAHNSEVV